MKVLILNWRDIKNPKSGGAEILTHELATRMIAKGIQVVQFSAEFPNSKKEETVDKIKIVRSGKPDARALLSSVHFQSYLYYRKNKDNFDLVIDEVHGIPFFTPLYVKTRKIALVCEVAGNIWDIAFKFPFNYLGKFIESIYPKFYKNIKIVTISNSSRKELIKLGFDKKNVYVIPLGCNVPVVKNLPKKFTKKTLIFVSRLTKSKGIEDAIEAVNIIKRKFPNIKLIIVGRGDVEYVNELKHMISMYKLDKNIEFKGFVSEKEKWELLGRSHILLAPSSKEGWGLTIHEAGGRGTPAIGYNVEGLRDVIIDGVNGFLCERNDYKMLAKKSIDLLSNSKNYSRIQKGAIDERKKYTWERTAKEFLKLIK